MMKKLLKIIRYINLHPLAGRHKLKAYAKLLHWQIWQLFFRRPKNMKLIHGVKMRMSKGMSGATGNIYTGLHEFNDMGFTMHLLREGDLFFDIGANVGSYTMLASGVCGAKTVAFEPVPSTYKSLSDNIHLNHLEGLVHAENTALGASVGTITFTSSLDARNHVLPDWITDVPSTEVPVCRADDFKDEYGVPVLVKMDVEGFEWEVLMGMHSLLASHDLKAVILELNTSSMRYGHEDQQIHQFMLNQGFTPIGYDPFNRLIQKLDSYGSHNTIYVRDLDWTTSRLEISKPFRIFGETI